MFRPRQIAALGAALFLSGCASTDPTVTQLREPEPVRTSSGVAVEPAPDGCSGSDASPAVIETVTEQIIVEPPTVSADGLTLLPAVYKTETRQRIVEGRRSQEFEALCPEEMTPNLVASLQRALKVRSLYDGPVTGQLDTATRAAIRAYQKPQGLDSAVLSLAAARQLGLIQVERVGVPAAG